MTRTEQGYAYWKEDPKAVRRARDVARAEIAKRRLLEQATAGVDWVVDTWPGRFAFVGILLACEGIAFILVSLGWVEG